MTNHTETYYQWKILDTAVDGTLFYMDDLETCYTEHSSIEEALERKPEQEENWALCRITVQAIDLDLVQTEQRELVISKLKDLKTTLENAVNVEKPNVLFFYAERKIEEIKKLLNEETN